MFENIIKVLVLLGLFYIIYKTNIHLKVLDGINRFTNHTKEYQKAQNEKKRFMKKFYRKYRLNEEI